jgi:hypothetical protein
MVSQPSDNWKRVIWVDESSFTLFPTSELVYTWRTPTKPTILDAWLQQWNIEGSLMVWAAILWYSIGPIITPHSRITAREYVDRLGYRPHPTIQTLFPNNDAVFKDDSAPSHTAGTVQSWFEEREGELRHLPWSAQSPDLSITEPLWTVLETRVRYRSVEHLKGSGMMVQNSTGLFKLVRCKKDCCCIEGNKGGPTAY